MKKVSMKISERLAAMKLFDVARVSMTTIAALLEDVKKTAISKEEWDSVELVKKKNTDGTEQWNWNDEKGEKEIELQQETIDYLASTIKQKSEAKEITIADAALVTLDKKLK